MRIDTTDLLVGKLVAAAGAVPLVVSGWIAENWGELVALATVLGLVWRLAAHTARARIESALHGERLQQLEERLEARERDHAAQRRKMWDEIRALRDRP